jgi:hypothetical protein
MPDSAEQERVNRAGYWRTLADRCAYNVREEIDEDGNPLIGDMEETGEGADIRSADREYLIFPGVFKELCDGIDLRVLIPELRKRNYLYAFSEQKGGHYGQIQAVNPENSPRRMWVFCVLGRILRD